MCVRACVWDGRLTDRSFYFGKKKQKIEVIKLAKELGYCYSYLLLIISLTCLVIKLPEKVYVTTLHPSKPQRFSADTQREQQKCVTTEAGSSRGQKYDTGFGEVTSGLSVLEMVH